MSLINFIDITKEYEEGHPAVRDVNLEIFAGEFVFLVGRSGAGKSTLLKLLIRETLPNSGDIQFKGESILEYPDSRMPDLRRNIGMVFQDFKLLESKNVFENIAVSLEVTGASTEEINSIVPNVLNMVGLNSKLFKYPRELSGGEKQRVAIARALAHEPDVLVADEPTGMIDPDAAEGIIDILSKVNLFGTTVIMATHNDSIVNKLKKRVIRIEDGRIVSDKRGGKYHE